MRLFLRRAQSPDKPLPLEAICELASHSLFIRLSNFGTLKDTWPIRFLWSNSLALFFVPLILKGLQTTIQSLIPQCDDVALVAISLQFGEEIPQQAHQESASMHCQELRRHVRDSDIIFLYNNGSRQYGLFFVLPEADMEGGQVVHQRLQELLASSVLSQTALAVPEHIEIRRYAVISGKGTPLIEAPDYTDIAVGNGTISAQIVPTQQHLPLAASQELLLLPDPERVSRKGNDET